MTQSKRAAARSTAGEFSPFATFIRVHDADEVFTDPRSSSTALAAAIDENDFLERWITCHFSLSVNLHDARREVARAGSTPEIEAILADLDVVQGVLLELHDYADVDERVRAFMRASYVVQHAVVAVYAWLSEILVAIPACGQGMARRRPSFVDEGDAPAYAMLRTLERLHPDLERLVRPDGLTEGDVRVDAEVAQKLSICFRQIGASIVRISGLASSFPPPPMKSNSTE